MRTVIEYEDKDILVAYKPAGLATQTARVGQQDMVSELKNYINSPYLGVVHRLDQPVEGLLVFGRTKKAAAALTGQLKQETLNKRYYAVVCGKPERDSAELVDYLYKTRDDGTKENRAQIAAASEAAQFGAGKAVLRYRLVDAITTADAEIFMLDIYIETGRFHQIRAQLAHANMPILGDFKYGAESCRKLSQNLGVRTVALCAYSLQLRHPADDRLLRFETAPRGEIFHKFTNPSMI